MILALDQGTTSSRAILFDHGGTIVGVAQEEFEQIFPQPGWVEHNPQDIWRSQLATARSVLSKTGIDPSEIKAIGITNQRETTVVWDRRTGEPIYNAIVWQDRRTAGRCDELRAEGHAERIQQKTGLVLDAYFSGTKLQWILDHVEGARSLANQGHLAFGTIDSWVVWNLTAGASHVTDASNASRTLLLDIHSVQWDPELCSLFNVPSQVLPEVVASSGIIGNTTSELFGVSIPIAGMAGDQQAALFGQACLHPGMVKNTYGTGCFMLMNTGSTPVLSKNHLLTTIAWKIGNQVEYALEGSVFMGGALVQWLRDGLEFVGESSEIEELAMQVPSSDGVVLVPAFTGLGAPHWDPYARGSIFGLTRGSTKAHIARAALESIALQVRDVIRAMELDADLQLSELRVDGGASANNLMMQFQADILQSDVIRPEILETTALGAAYLAGIAVGFWDGSEEVAAKWQKNATFHPSASSDQLNKMISNWNKALDRAKNWESA